MRTASALGLLAVLTAARAVVIEDFDDGSVVLCSYPGEDVHPDSWRLDSVTTHDSSPFALQLYGNTWKVETIQPVRLDTGDVWQVAAYVEDRGEIQGFGLADSAHALLYSFAGSELLDPDNWATVYQGAFPERTWNSFPLPVGEDWLQRFGYLPEITALVFVNDRDSDPRAVAYFDRIEDITADLPVAPQVEAWYETVMTTDNRDGSWDVTVQFHSRVTDPDSRTHDYYWYFGDDATSRDSAPEHTYTVRDNHDYTVLLQVRDSTDRWGRSTCRVRVDPGPTTFPVRLNFVGDIMLARGYDNPGGIIDTIGAEGIFAPTRVLLGPAADFTVANLESPLTNRGTRHPTKPIVFRGRPTNVAGLVYAGIDVVSLANNHVIDYGLEGMQQTQQVLGAARIMFSGAGRDIYEASLPLFCQKSGLNIAFLAYCDRNGQYDNYQPFLDAGLNKPGFAYLDSFHVRRAIERVRDLADLVVVEMHTGEEYEPTPEKDGDEMYSRLALFPAPNDTAERHRAIEAGADLVVCHHPHVLQGFEVYQGRLIVHSLGNYAFDLGYPETYPTVVLNALADEPGPNPEIDCHEELEVRADGRKPEVHPLLRASRGSTSESGVRAGVSGAAPDYARPTRVLHGYTVVPVYIDDWIPRPATGRLGRHILDYLAQRSRELNTWLIVRPDSLVGQIVLDTAALEPWIEPHAADLHLREEGGYWVSEPLALARAGSLSRVVSVVPSGNWQVRVGRELVWFGGFEDEGATMWLLASADEFYDTVALHGARSLCQVRRQGATGIVTNLEKRLTCNVSTRPHSISASLRTENAESAAVEFRCYSVRTGGTQLAGFSTAPVTGTTNWQTRYTNFTPAAQTAYFDVALRSRGPGTGDGRVWFDDVSAIEWGDWQSLSQPVSTPEPNDIYWLQLRTAAAVSAATVNYEETRYDAIVPLRQPASSRPLFRQLALLPNPTRAAARIQYELTSPARVSVKVFDAAGREVQPSSFNAQYSPPGARPSAILLDLRGLSPGTYFCSVAAGLTRRTLKLLLVH